MTTGLVQEQNLEKQIQKQMGCMAGFLQIFDRPSVLVGKRLYSAKRLPPSSGGDSSPEPEKIVAIQVTSGELEKTTETRSMTLPERGNQSFQAEELRSPVSTPGNTAQTVSTPPSHLPTFEFKEGTRSSWKFARDAPRLSLDSRAIVDAKGSIRPREIRTNVSMLSANGSESSKGVDDGDKQRRSPSVIARLMGLEPLPNSESEPVQGAVLRRSASESRASKDFYRFRVVDGSNFHQMQSQQSNSQVNIASSLIINNAAGADNSSNSRAVDRKNFAARTSKTEPAKTSHRGMRQRKSYFDSGEVFPEPKPNVSICGEIERRLKMRGIDEPSKDLETLKQILEALQLKGLLHSKKSLSQSNQRNFVCERISWQIESPIVVMKPARSPSTVTRFRRIGGESPPSSFVSRSGARRTVNVIAETENWTASTPRRERWENDRNVRNQNGVRNSRSPTRNENRLKSPSRRGGTSCIETQRRGNDRLEQRKISPAQSPKLNSRRNGYEQQTTNSSPRCRKRTADIHTQGEDESSTVSESSRSTSSQNDQEKGNRGEEQKEGRSLLDRCDKLLRNIAEITAPELQPSPVSVLDSSFYKEESSPSPVMKRQIDFRDQLVEVEDDTCSLPISSADLKFEERFEDCDFVYISEILRAWNNSPEGSDVFLLLEKQQYLKGRDTSEVSRLQRKLIYDTVNEILDRKKRLPPWKIVSWSNSTSLHQIWSEFQRIQQKDGSSELLEVICGVLRKDLAGDGLSGWGEWPVEMSEMVLDIERLVFKDLIGETIRDLAALAGSTSALRRKLVF